MPQGAWGATGQGLGDAARAALLQGPVVCVRAGTWSSVSTCKITFQSEFNPTLNCSNVTNQLVSISLKLNVIYAGWGGSCQNETRLRSSAKHTHADEPHKRLNPPLEDYTRGISESIWKHSGVRSRVTPNMVSFHEFSMRTDFFAVNTHVMSQGPRMQIIGTDTSMETTMSRQGRFVSFGFWNILKHSLNIFETSGIFWIYLTPHDLDLFAPSYSGDGQKGANQSVRSCEVLGHKRHKFLSLLRSNIDLMSLI